MMDLAFEIECEVAALTSLTLHPAHAARTSAMAHIIAQAGGAVFPRQVLSHVVLAGLGTFAIDDVIDDPELPLAYVKARVADVIRSLYLEHAPEVAFDPTASAWRTLSHFVRACARDEAHWVLWLHEAAATIEAMLEHRLHASESVRHTPADFQRITFASIGLHLFVLTAAICWRGSARPSLKLFELCDHAAKAARFANDARSFERETTEQTANLIGTMGLSRDEVVSAARASLLDLETAVELVDAGDLDLGAFVLGLTRGILKLYEAQDFHEHGPSSRVAE